MSELPHQCDLKIEGLVLHAQGLIDPGVVLIDKEQIIWSGHCQDAPDVQANEVLAHDDGHIIPGFIDLHVHGARGADAVDGSARSLEIICRAHAAHGTIALCPTILTSPPKVFLRALEVIREATEKPITGARILGAHLEGPFLNPKRAGAQPKEFLLKPDSKLLEEIFSAAGETLKIMTFAPELPGALDLKPQLKERGVIAAMGHSDATYAESRAAVELGANLATHTFNGMRGLHHREPGLVGCVLGDDAVVAEVIADGLHVCPPILNLLWKLKCNDRLALVTDCTAALEAPAGQARLGNQPVEARGFSIRLPDGTLAGSNLTLERAVATLIQMGGATIRQAVNAASKVPAEILGLRDQGSLTSGKRADLLFVDHQLRIKKTIIDGKIFEPSEK